MDDFITEQLVIDYLVSLGVEEIKACEIVADAMKQSSETH
jgi:hypothetical protein